MSEPFDQPLDEAGAAVDADIRDLASRLGPKLGANYSVPASRGLGAEREQPTASLIAKRLEQAIETARELEKTATVLGMALHGPVNSALNSAKSAPAPDYLFGRQAAALDELQVVHGRIRSALERIGAVLR